MSADNNFQHAPYSRADPGDRVAYREFVAGAPAGSAAWTDAMSALGGPLSGAGVRAVLFLHGSLLGTDLFGMQRLDEVGGLKRGYSRGISGLDALLAAMREDTNGLSAAQLAPPIKDDAASKTCLDDQLGDAGNFTNTAVAQFQQAINQNLSHPIACRRTLWSCEHHHLGRAIATLLVLDQLRTLCANVKLVARDRLLVLAHGHAGQLLALASNFLAPSGNSGKKKLLDLVTAYAQQTSQDALWGLIRRMEPLLEAGTMLNGASLDVVTFGTPVRYGWDRTGLGRLLHIINHRALRADGKRWLAKMDLPQITVEMPVAWGGDYVQQLAVAGCDALPLTPEAKSANKAIWELVEPWDGFERWLECARKSVRCPVDGVCLLVDYKDCTGSAAVRDHYYGHAAYTRSQAILFNMTEIVNALYASPRA